MSPPSPAPSSSPSAVALPPPAPARQQQLDVPCRPDSQFRPRPSLDGTYSNTSELSIYADEFRPSQTRSFISHYGPPPRLPPPSPRRRGWRGRLNAAWIRNKGVLLVLLSQLFGSGMNATTRILETDGGHGEGMHPFQILFARQSLTTALSLTYGLMTHIPHFPFGPAPLLPLLVTRGLAGFVGVVGLYFSLLHLPLAEATVLTFLVPILTCYACSLFLPGETFSRQQQMAAVLSLVGVIFIARPGSLFGARDAAGGSSSASASGSPAPASSRPSVATPHQHLVAILSSLIGIVGSVVAMTCIRAIGPHAHPLISVNYFSAWCTVVSLVAVLAVPSVGFRLPRNVVEWGLLTGLGVCGFVMQFLLTAGLSYGAGAGREPGGRSESVVVSEGILDEEVGDRDPEARARPDAEAGGPQSQLRSSKNGDLDKESMKNGSGTRATNMVYTQMLFALAFDKWIWGITPSAMSWIGSGLILGNAVWVAVARDRDQGNGGTRPGGNDCNAGNENQPGTGSASGSKRWNRKGQSDDEAVGLMSAVAIGDDRVATERAGQGTGDILEMNDLTNARSEETENRSQPCGPDR